MDIISSLVDLLPNVAFPILLVFCFGVVIYKLIIRIMDENKERESKLVEINAKISDSLEDVAKSIENSDKINKELSETNRLLLDKFEGKLEDIDKNINEILVKIDK